MGLGSSSLSEIDFIKVKAQIACTFTYKWDNQAFLSILLFFILAILIFLFKMFISFFSSTDSFITQGPYVISSQLNFSVITYLCLNRIIPLSLFLLFLESKDLNPSHLSAQSVSAHVMHCPFLGELPDSHSSKGSFLPLSTTFYIVTYCFYLGVRGGEDF